MAKKVIQISAITMDGSTQMRARMDDDFIDDLAELYKGEAEIPPPVCFWDGTTYWPGDGHHRILGATKAELKVIEAEIIQGTRQDAVLYACSANDAHGIRRSAADKRKAVRTLLEDKLWKTRSDRWIAHTCRVGHQLVATVREQLLSSGGSSTASTEPRISSDGRTITMPEKDDDAPKVGEEVFNIPQFHNALNTLRKAPDRLYRACGKVRRDNAIDRDADWDAIAKPLEAFLAAFEKRWFELKKEQFPQQ